MTKSSKIQLKEKLTLFWPYLCKSEHNNLRETIAPGFWHLQDLHLNTVFITHQRQELGDTSVRLSHFCICESFCIRSSFLGCILNGLRRHSVSLQGTGQICLLSKIIKIMFLLGARAVCVTNSSLIRLGVLKLGVSHLWVRLTEWASQRGFSPLPS